MKKHFLLLSLVLVLAAFLRLYNIITDPPSLYWEEAAIGYDAYSILKTGKDQHGFSFPIAYFTSFADYKPSLYFYTAVPSIAVFGLTEFAVRFPSALFGILSVLFTYLLVLKLFKRQDLALVSVLFLAISPWSLQFSRAAFEANLASFLVILGAYLFIKGVSGKSYWFIISTIPFSLSLYAYHGARIFTLLLVLSLLVIYFPKIWQAKKAILIGIVLSILLLLPVFSSLISKTGQQRFLETSRFTQLAPIQTSNELISQDNGGRVARLLHHRFLEYASVFWQGYFDHFKPDFLFVSGDKNPRHGVQDFGILYWFDALFLLSGLYFIAKRKEKGALPILAWLVLAPVPAALTLATPHALRSIFFLPTFQIISAYGLLSLIKIVKERKSIFQKPVVWGLGIFVAANFLYYLHFYYNHYPRLYSQEWQYGYRQTVNFVTQNQNKYDKIIFTNEYGRAYIYYLFYTKYDPAKFQSLTKIPKDPSRLQGEYQSFEKFEFRNIEWENDFKLKNALLVGSPKEIPADVEVLKTVNFLDGKEAFKIVGR